MKLRKLVSISLLAIPMYFFTINAANADEFKINLKDEEVKVEKNVVDDLDLAGFNQRVYDRIEKKVDEKYYNFELSYGLARFLEDPEDAMTDMKGHQKEQFLEDISDEMQSIIRKELRGQFQEEFKESEFYYHFQKKLKYYNKKIKESFRKKKVTEKEASVELDGTMKLEYKKHKFKKSVGPVEAVVEEVYIEKTSMPDQLGALPNIKRKLYFKRYKTGIIIKEDGGFELKAKFDLLKFRNFQPEPRLEIDLKTQYVTLNSRVDYEIKDQQLDMRLNAILPQGYHFYILYSHNMDDTDAVITGIQKGIKKWTTTLSYTASTDNFDEGTFWIRLERKF